MNIISTRLNEERIAYEEEIRQLKAEVKRLQMLDKQKQLAERGVMTNEELEMMRGMQEGVAIRIADLEAEVERLQDAAKAYQQLAVCYRIGKRPTEKLHRQLEKANKILKVVE